MIKFGTNRPISLFSLTTSLTRGLEEDEGTKIVEFGADTLMLCTKPNSVLSEGDF